MTNVWIYRRAKDLLAVAALLVLMCLVGCSEDPGLQERVVRLQAEMQEKDRRLQEAQASLERTRAELKSARAAAGKPPAAEPPGGQSAPAFLPKGQVDDGYAVASADLRARLADELKNYTVEDCIGYPVVMPTDERPYRSRVALLVRAEGGRSYRLEFPVSADPSGKWTFPSTDDVAGALADSRAQETDRTASNPPRNPSPGNARSPVSPGQVSNETRVIDWGDDRPSDPPSRPVRTTPARNDADPVAPGSVPSPARPSDRDVRVHW